MLFLNKLWLGIEISAVSYGIAGTVATLLIWYFWRAGMRVKRRAIPSLRSAIVRLHKDLLEIDKLTIFPSDEELTEFEKLVLVLEDRRFLRHNGVDYRACFRELAKALFLRKHGGASTIDMQFVRTATGYRQPTIGRKLYEILLAKLIQFRYSKTQILRSYLNCAFFGSRLYSCHQAALVVQNKPLFKVTRQEAAEIAAMLVYPRPKYPGNSWILKIKRRAAYGLKRLNRFEKSFKQIPSGE